MRLYGKRRQQVGGQGLEVEDMLAVEPGVVQQGLQRQPPRVCAVVGGHGAALQSGTMAVTSISTLARASISALTCTAVIAAW